MVQVLVSEQYLGRLHSKMPACIWYASCTEYSLKNQGRCEASTSEEKDLMGRHRSLLLELRFMFSHSYMSAGAAKEVNKGEQPLRYQPASCNY